MTSLNFTVFLINHTACIGTNGNLFPLVTRKISKFSVSGSSRSTNVEPYLFSDCLFALPFDIGRSLFPSPSFEVIIFVPPPMSEATIYEIAADNAADRQFDAKKWGGRWSGSLWPRDSPRVVVGTILCEVWYGFTLFIELVSNKVGQGWLTIHQNFISFPRNTMNLIIQPSHFVVLNM